MTPRRLVWWLIAGGVVLRLVMALIGGLGVDESYAVASARVLSLSYFDHPPLSFWLVHASAHLFRSESHLAVRLPFIALFAATTWLIYRQTARAFGEQQGWLAALFLNLSPVFSVSTASWVLPDGPLMCGLAGAGYCLVRVLLDPAGDRHATRWWLAAGVCTGVALLSKYQAVLFLAGVGLFLIASSGQRRWLRRPAPYAALAIALALFSPVIIWNARHGWASFAFQLGRNAEPAHAGLLQRIGALAQTLGGQALWVLPWLWVPLIWVLVSALTRRPREDRRVFFAYLAAVPIGLFAAVSLSGRPALPHWPASGYFFLFPLLGAAVIDRVHALAERRDDSRRHHPISIDRRGPTDRRLRPILIWAAWSVASFILVLIVGMSAIATGWHTRALAWAFRRGDPTLEAADWQGLARGLDSLGLLHRAHTFIAATSWVQAGKAAYALGPQVSVLCLSVDPRHFGFLFDQRAFLGEDAVIVDRLPERHDIYARYGPYFASVTPIGEVAIRRMGTPIFGVGVYLARNFERPFPATAMPTGALTAIPRRESADYLPPDSTQNLSLGERAR
jgi:4-amino-4-deoxy-L-arabinose transferase-like glycosyltransferase